MTNRTTPTSQTVEAALVKIGTSALIIGNLPELPGYKCGLRILDNKEATRLRHELDEAAATLREALAPHVPVERKKPEDTEGGDCD